MSQPFNFKDFKPLLDKAGVTVIEAACIFRATRTTIYKWMKGNGPKQELLRQFALKWITAMQKAVDSKSLPLPEDTPHADRMKLIVEVLKRHSV